MGSLKPSLALALHSASGMEILRKVIFSLSSILHQVWILALASALMVASTMAAASESHDARVIQSVEYVGLHALPGETLDFYLFGGQVKPGDPLDLADLNKRIKVFWQRELVDDVRVEVRAAGELVIRIVERPTLVSIEYVGLKRLSRADIAQQIDRERLAVQENMPLNLGEMRRLELAIEELYKEKGFRFAQVHTTFEESAPGQRQAVVTVDEGTKVRIGDIHFDGNTIYGDWRLRRAMKKTKQSGLISRFSKKDIYNPAHLEEDMAGVKDLYRKSGYKDALVARPELDVVARRPEAESIAEQKRRLVVTVPVEEGERWRLGDVRFEGNEVLGEVVLRGQFETPRGGWLRSKVIDDGLEKIDKLYKSIGYIFADVQTEIEEVGADTADVIVKIEERDQFRIGRVDFEGNTKTRDRVLRREMFLQEGSIMNMSAVQSSLLRIRQLQYFALDEEEPVQFDFDADQREVHLKVSGEEADRTELQFGGGWSEPDGFFGHFGIRTTNFRGRGETLGISLQAGEERDLYDLQYGLPWFLNRPQNLTFRLFKQDRTTRVTNDVTFESDQTGASFAYGRSLRGFHSVNFTYVFSDLDEVNVLSVAEEDDIFDGVQDGLVSQRGRLRISSLVPSWSYNTLDSRYEPTQGLRSTASLELAGGPLGGQSSYVRPRFGLTWFQPVSRKPFKSSFGLRIDAGLIAPFGDTDDADLLASQRFYLGGESSVRGFRSGTITVREADGDRAVRYDESGIIPLGGDKKFSLGLEYHIMPRGPVRLVFFGDAGGVFASDQSLDPSLMRYSAGAELRVAVPLFPAPLRFIWAQNLDPLDGDRFESFDFSLSASF